MRWLFLLLLLCASCDEWVEPRVIAPPPPPGNGGTTPITLGQGTAAALLFVHVDQSRADGQGRPSDTARSADESIARVFRANRDATSRATYPESGHVFVVYGVAPGETDLTVYSGETALGPIHVKVSAQAP